MDPNKVVKDYEKSNQIRDERNAARQARKIAKKARAKVIEAERAFAPPRRGRPAGEPQRYWKNGNLQTVVFRIPKEISQEIDDFCERFGLTRTTWFIWAVCTQHLTYKKMLKDAEGKENP